MNIKRFALVAALVINVVTTPAASAGLFDWLAGRTDASVNPTISFDELYRRVTTPSTANAKESNIALIQQNTVTAQMAPATTSAKTTVAKAQYTVSVSAYSSTPDQTDDSPFITARGTYVRDGIVATNFLPFGTRIKFPDVFGDKIFVVEDRMNKRYQTNVDIWMSDRESALQFGRKNLVIEVLP